MLSSTSRNVLKRVSQRPSAHTYSPDAPWTGPACRHHFHRQLSSAAPPANHDSTLRAKPWAFVPDNAFKGTTSVLGRCQYEAISHAKAKRRLVPCLRLVAQMKKEGVQPSLVIYNSLLACIAEEALPLEAWAVVDDMTAMGLTPVRQSYHHLIHACRWSSINSMWKVVDKMLELNIQPNEQTYALIMKRMTTTESVELALQFMHEMTSRGLTPELITAQDVVRLAADLDFPRLAVNLAQNFEAQSLRRFDGEAWMSCLISSAEMLYAEGVEICWKKVIHGLNLSPDEGACLSVLHTCARHGLADLAIDVKQVLRKIGIEWQEYHFTPLMEAFCRAGRIKDAFNTLNVMRNDGIVPTSKTASSIAELLQKDVDFVDGAWGALDEMRREGKTVETTAINAILHASITLGDLQRAIGAYQSFPDYDCKPDVETFNYLLAGCTAAKRRELGDKLLQDMKQAAVKPNASTYEHVILLCLTCSPYEDAFFYLEELKAQKLVPPLKVYEMIIRTCITAGDSRYTLALTELGQCGYQLSRDLQQFLKEHDITCIPLGGRS
ncbi:hypothetical protein F5I97DRAFT_740900 [Phlebopus sp. FC_14]|nr:hypothetical protein F5I97DRAFT_740900 [Phlebopus sp. FC_14]